MGEHCPRSCSSYSRQWRHFRRRGLRPSTLTDDICASMAFVARGAAALTLGAAFMPGNVTVMQSYIWYASCKLSKHGLSAGMAKRPGPLALSNRRLRRAGADSSRLLARAAGNGHDFQADRNACLLVCYVAGPTDWHGWCRTTASALSCSCLPSCSAGL